MSATIQVLIVEDSEPDAQLIVRELQRGGYEPEYERVDSAAAMDVAVQTHSWDVIIADYVLPHFSGLDALRMVQEKGLDMPFIVVSGKIDDDAATDTMRAGAQDYVLKNNLARLAPATRREIRDARMRRQAIQAREQAEAALKRAYDEQEQRIAARTAELSQSNLLFAREIEEHRLTEKALRDSEERYRALIKASSEALYRMSPDWREMRQLRGGNFIADTDEPNENWLEEYIYPEDRNKVMGVIREAVRTGGVFELEHRVRRRDGAVGWTYSRAVPVRNADGEIVEWFGAASDITERKQTEEELAKARAKAERQAAELQSFMSNVADGLAVVDAEGGCVYLNEAGCGMLGVPHGHMCANWLTDYQRYTLEGEPLPVEATAAYRALHGETVIDLLYRMVVAGGKELVIGASASPVRDNMGRIHGATVVFRDQKERIDLEQEREAMSMRDRHIAEVLQGVLIPPIESVDFESCNIAMKYEPGLKEAEVGGDFYDIFDLGQGLVGIVIGDVAGKGLIAAAYVAAARHAIRSYAYLFPSPARILSLANESLCRGEIGENIEKSMLTAFLAIIDTRAGTMTFANAGHEPPVVRGADGEVKQLDGAPGIPLGVMCGYAYDESRYPLEVDEAVVLVTDGITEARQDSSLLFGIEGLINYLRQNPQQPVGGIPEGVVQAARSYAGGEFQDDVAIVAFRCGVEKGAAQ